MRFSSRESEDLRYLHDNYELVFSGPERKECPIKGSSARVAKRTWHCQSAAGRTSAVAIDLRLAEG
jgi:hypothetical protein